MSRGVYKRKNGIAYGNTGKKASLELIEKLSKSHLGQKAWNKGIKSSKEQIEKQRLKMIGRKASEETKKKMSIAHKGEKSYMWKGGLPKCIDCGKELKSYLSKRCVKCEGRLHSGKNSPSWKGGVTKIDKLCRNMPEYKQWRSDVFQRDNWTCKTCNVNGIYVTAHHIKGFNKILKENNIKTIEEARKCFELWDINNGITLCEKCHSLTDNYRGKSINK